MKEREIECLEARLENWRQWWCYFGDGAGLTISRCLSAERNYIAPRPDDDKLLRASAPQIDVADAQRVEDALWRLPWNPVRAFLLCWYGKAMPLRVFMRAARMTIEEIDPFRRRNLELLSIELARQDRATVHLIRRGKKHWAGVECIDNAGYKAATFEPSKSRGQAIAWSRRAQKSEE